MNHRMGALFQTPWTRRIEEEADRFQSLAEESSILEVEAIGDPPSKFILTFKGRTLAFRGSEETVARTVEVPEQKVEITVGLEYPRQPPTMRWLTPIAHPNIWGQGTVCLPKYGMDWSPSVHLTDVAEVLWDMARFAIQNPKSAGTGGSNAVEFWGQVGDKFGYPTDPRPLRDLVLGTNEGSSMVRPTGDEDDIMIIDDDSEGCVFG